MTLKNKKRKQISPKKIDKKKNKKECKKRVVTSAIAGMSVPEVRFFLNIVRKKWDNKSEESPFCIIDELTNFMTVEQFCYAFVVGNHKKRHGFK
jgi:hypothetical protein